MLYNDRSIECGMCFLLMISNIWIYKPIYGFLGLVQKTSSIITHYII